MIWVESWLRKDRFCPKGVIFGQMSKFLPRFNTSHLLQFLCVFNDYILIFSIFLLFFKNVRNEVDQLHFVFFSRLNICKKLPVGMWSGNRQNEVAQLQLPFFWKKAKKNSKNIRVRALKKGQKLGLNAISFWPKIWNFFN